MRLKTFIAASALALGLGTACSAPEESDPVASACAERVGIENTSALANCIYETQRILDGDVTTTSTVPGAARQEAGARLACGEKRFGVRPDQRDTFADFFANEIVKSSGRSDLRAPAREGCLSGLRGY